MFHLVDSSRKVHSFRPTAPPAQYIPMRTLKWVDETQTVLDGCGLLPIERLDIPIRCPLNVSPTRWAIHQLTNKELLGVFDWSESLVMDFPEGCDLPFARSAPGRLLSAILDTISHTPKPVVLPLTEKLTTTSSSKQQINWPKAPGTDWHGVSESTTTADDTQAPTEVWDSRVLGKLVHSQKLTQIFEEQ
jgi:hypothetical protein